MESVSLSYTIAAFNFSLYALHVEASPAVGRQCSRTALCGSSSQIHTGHSLLLPRRPQHGVSLVLYGHKRSRHGTRRDASLLRSSSVLIALCDRRRRPAAATPPQRHTCARPRTTKHGGRRVLGGDTEAGQGRGAQLVTAAATRAALDQRAAVEPRITPCRLDTIPRAGERPLPRRMALLSSVTRSCPRAPSMHATNFARRR